MSYDLHCVLYEFLHILPPKLFKLFSLITVSFANYSNFFVKARHQTWSAKGFEKFQIVTHEFLGCQFLEKYNFGQSLIHQKKKKKNSGYFAIIEYVISTLISRCTFRIYILLYG